MRTRRSCRPHSRGSVDMVRVLPDDGKRYEVIDGELFVTPAPSWRHQDAVLQMATRLAPYVSTHGIGHVPAHRTLLAALRSPWRLWRDFVSGGQVPRAS